MAMRFGLYCLTLFLTLCTPRSAPGQSGSAHIPNLRFWKETKPDPKGDRYLGFIEWGADADMLDSKSDRHAVVRWVINWDNQPRRIEWPVGRMIVTPLRPAEMAIHQAAAYGITTAKGDLEYDRDPNLRHPTEIFEGREEQTRPVPTASRPLRFRWDYRSGPVKVFQSEANPPVFLSVQTDVDYNGEAFEIRYRVTNRGAQPLQIRLPFSAKFLDDFPESFAPGKSFDFTLTTSEPPIPQELPIYIIENGRLSAQVQGIMVVPVTDW